MNDKNVLITGVGRGIGKAIAEKFLNEGWKVYGTFYSSQAQAEELKSKYGKENLTLYGPYNFSDLNDTNTLIKDLSGIKFDSIVLSAGIFSENDDFLNFDLEEFNKTMNCNFYTPLMLGIRLQNSINNNGSIIIISSNDAYSGAFGSIAYSISKAALLNLTKCLCVNYGNRGIRVNSVAPGAINTDMNTPEQEFDAPQFTPIERIGQPNEVADVVYFLSSSNASFVNGENITIDGGYSVVSVLLKNEVSRIRKYAGYDYIYNKYNELKKGDTVIQVNPCPSYTWIDNESENKYMENCIMAEKRGVSIKRILIVDECREDELKDSLTIKKYFAQLQPQSKMFVVKKADVKTICPEDYEKVGCGYGIFNGEEIFVDSYSNDDSIGYILKGESLINPLLESFNNLLNNIEKGKIEQIEIK